jgi:predicted nucleic acid-binding protein
VILVDTSVWVAAFRSAQGIEAGLLRELLDRDEVALALPVRVEILSGASVEDRRRLRRTLSALPTFSPVESTWQLIDTWVDRAGEVGERFGFVDLLIGALAAERSFPVWSLDSDFERMERIGLLARHVP